MTPDMDILKKAECLSIEAMVMRNRLHWAGHVVWMEDVRLPKQLFYGELKTGKCSQYGPKRRFKDCIKDDFKAFKFPVQKWEILAKPSLNGVGQLEVDLKFLKGKESIMLSSREILGKAMCQFC